MDDNKKWTKRDVRAILINPIYAGIPPFPSAITDEEWITAQQKRIDGGEDLKKYFTDILFYLRQSFAATETPVPACVDPARINDDEWNAVQVETVGKNTRRAMATLLQELRSSVPQGTVSNVLLPGLAVWKERRASERRQDERRKR